MITNNCYVVLFCAMIMLGLQQFAEADEGGDLMPGLIHSSPVGDASPTDVPSVDNVTLDLSFNRISFYPPIMVQWPGIEYELSISEDIRLIAGYSMITATEGNTADWYAYNIGVNFDLFTIKPAGEIYFSISKIYEGFNTEIDDIRYKEHTSGYKYTLGYHGPWDPLKTTGNHWEWGVGIDRFIIDDIRLDPELSLTGTTLPHFKLTWCF
jgi:hypothetical protein